MARQLQHPDWQAMRKLLLVVAIPVALGFGCVFNPQPDPPGVETGDYAGGATGSGGSMGTGTTANGAGGGGGGELVATGTSSSTSGGGDLDGGTTDCDHDGGAGGAGGAGGGAASGGAGGAGGGKDCD